MKRFKIFVVFVAVTAIFIFTERRAFSEDYIMKLDDVRTSITNQGNALPDLIRNAKSTDIRTLERVYELNTSALTTIEAYFKMLKVALSASEMTETSLASLDEWLMFIYNQCKYDIEYLDEALGQTNEEAILAQIQTAKGNLQRLSNLTTVAIEQNSSIFRR